MAEVPLLETTKQQNTYRVQLFPHNYSYFYTGLTFHTRNPHNPTKTTTMNLLSSGSREEFGDRITRQLVPLAVNPF